MAALKRSAKTSKKAELTKLRRLYSEEFQIIKIVRATGNEVTIGFEGFEHTFSFVHGHVRKIPNARHLSRDDYAFLLRFAEEIMVAVFKGYVKRPQKKAAAKTSNPQLTLI